MKYNFDKEVDRRDSYCAKWEILKEENLDPEIIPMWVADMDFEVPRPIVEALKKRLEHPVFGYTRTSDSYYDAIISWYQKNYQWTIKKDEILPIPGVVAGINDLIHQFTEVGDGIIIQSPVYHQFYNQIVNTKRKVIDNPLLKKEDHYEMDFEDLDEKMKQAKMMILCSPHNPVGRIWTKDELQKLGDLCKKHNILLIADEIHQDIRRKGKTHHIFNQVDPSFKEFTIYCTAPNKSFNIAGFKTANLIIQNPELRDEMEKYLENKGYKGNTFLGNIAQEIAYRHGEEWLNEVNEYIDENISYTLEYFEKYIPEIKIQEPEGSYLLWLDCSGLGLSGDHLQKFFVEEAKVLLNQGGIFGKDYEDHMRMNIATRRKRCEKACERIRKAVEKRRGK